MSSPMFVSQHGGAQPRSSAAQSPTGRSPDQQMKKIIDEHRKNAEIKQKAIAFKKQHDQSLEEKPHTQGHTEFLNSTSFPGCATVLNSDDPSDEYTPKFDSLKMALAYREALRDDGKYVEDDTLPDDEHKPALVGVLFRAFKSIAIAGDGASMVKPFKEQRHDNELTEIICWQILEGIIKRSYHDMQLVLAYEPMKARQNPSYMTFQERFDAVVESMRKSKTICKHLFDVPYYCTFVDDPTKAENRISANRKLNGQKAYVMQVGRSNLTEEDKKAHNIKDWQAPRTVPRFTSVRPNNEETDDELTATQWTSNATSELEDTDLGLDEDDDEDGEYKPPSRTPASKKRKLNIQKSSPASSPLRRTTGRGKPTPRNIKPTYITSLPAGIPPNDSQQQMINVPHDQYMAMHQDQQFRVAGMEPHLYSSYGSPVYNTAVPPTTYAQHYMGPDEFPPVYSTQGRLPQSSTSSRHDQGSNVALQGHANHPNFNQPSRIQHYSEHCRPIRHILPRPDQQTSPNMPQSQMFDPWATHETTAAPYAYGRNNSITSHHAAPHPMSGLHEVSPRTRNVELHVTNQGRNSHSTTDEDVSLQVNPALQGTEDTVTTPYGGSSSDGDAKIDVANQDQAFS